MSRGTKLHASMLFSITIMLLTVPAATAEEKPYEKSGFYIAATWDRAELSNQTSVTESETDGTATSLSIGYRYDANWRVEYHQKSIEFDDTRAGLPSVPVTDIECDYQNLNILYQQEAGVWLPYFGLAYTRLDFTETHAPLDGPIFRRQGGTIETSNDGFSFLFGVDYPLTDRFHLRTDWTIYNSDYLESHDLIRLSSVFHF
ncbi:MAG: outer membrane beta-barrel protein [Parvibaculales bacterium]